MPGAKPGKFSPGGDFSTPLRNIPKASPNSCCTLSEPCAGNLCSQQEAVVRSKTPAPAPERCMLQTLAFEKDAHVHKVSADNQVHGCGSTYQVFTLKLVSLQHSSKSPVNSALMRWPQLKFPLRFAGHPVLHVQQPGGTA